MVNCHNNPNFIGLRPKPSNHITNSDVVPTKHTWGLDAINSTPTIRESSLAYYIRARLVHKSRLHSFPSFFSISIIPIAVHTHRSSVWVG